MTDNAKTMPSKRTHAARVANVSRALAHPFGVLDDEAARDVIADTVLNALYAFIPDGHKFLKSELTATRYRARGGYTQDNGDLYYFAEKLARESGSIQQMSAHLIDVVIREYLNACSRDSVAIPADVQRVILTYDPLKIVYYPVFDNDEVRRELDIRYPGIWNALAAFEMLETFEDDDDFSVYEQLSQWLEQRKMPASSSKPEVCLPDFDL